MKKHGKSGLQWSIERWAWFIYIQPVPPDPAFPKSRTGQNRTGSTCAAKSTHECINAGTKKSKARKQRRTDREMVSSKQNDTNINDSRKSNGKRLHIKEAR